MPAYLTHAAVLTKMVDWLEFLRTHIESRRKALPQGTLLTDIDVRFYDLAGKALTYLREEASTPPDVALPVTSIKNGIGTRISKFAFAGSLGPDLPAAGYVLAMNQDWAWHQLHNGEPRRAKKNARSTMFVLKLLELLEKDETEGRITRAARRRMISYALGHLSHIAADVVIHPAIHQLTWNKSRGPLDPLEHKLFEVAIDARVAQGYFNRVNLYDDIQSWEDYYPTKGDFKEELKLLMVKLSGAFKATYEDERPTVHVCGLEDPKKCAAPKFDADFLMDAYRNTTNWAIDEGYDHSPDSMDTLWWASVLASAIMSSITLAGGTKSVGTVTNLLFGANEAVLAELSNDADTKWQENGTADWEVWRDIFEQSTGWADKVAMPYEWLFGGGVPMAIITFGQASKGFFGQDEGVEDSNPAIRTINSTVWGIKSVGFIALGEIVPQLTEQGWWKTLWVIVDFAHDLIEHGALKSESLKDNYSEDRLDNATWGPKKILATSNFIGNALTMLWKSSRKELGNNTRRANGIEPEDFVLPFIFANVTAAIFVWSGMWRNHLLFKTTKSHWPSSDTKPVDTILPVKTADGRKTFDDAAAEKFRVRLFPDAALKTDGGESFYPDGGGAPRDVEGQKRRDIDARKAALTEFADAEYSFPELLDHAAHFAGLLSMAAVAYNETAPPVRQHMTGLFKDWNLDFSTVDQWNDLFKSSALDDMGLLVAAHFYTKDLDAFTLPSNQVAMERLRLALGVTDVAGSIRGNFVHNRMSEGGVHETALAMRTTRPGLVVIPNLDIETPAPSPLPSPLPLRTGDLDALRDDTINPELFDLNDLGEFEIRKPLPPGSPHTLVLRLHATDANRVRVFAKNSGPQETWPVVLGFTSGGVKTEFEIDPAAPDVTKYAIEVKGFAGDPTMPAPTGPGPLAPAPFPVAGAAVGSPVVAERRESDVWLEVIHKDNGVEVPGIRDVALFSIAPLLLQSNMRKAECLYAAYLPDQFDGAGTLLFQGNYPFVTDLIRALKSDVAIAPRVKFRTVPATNGTLDEYMPNFPFRAGEPNEAGAIYLVDGLTYGHVGRKRLPTDPDFIVNDPWVQDEFEIGYSDAPQSRMHVVLHNPRKGDLAAFVEKELPSVDVALFNGLSSRKDSINYGGNLEVSPPVSVAVVAQPRSAAGLEIPAQPVSPLGKILLGEGMPFLFDIPERFGAELQAGTISAELVTELNGHNIRITTADPVEVRIADREWLTTNTAVNAVTRRTYTQTLFIRREPGVLKVHAARLAAKELKHFLEAQRAQPVVTVDTSWLSVGHVDEIFIFVPATSGGKDFRLLMASSQLAVDLLQAAKDISDPDPVGHPLTNLFRGRSWTRLPRGRVTFAASDTVTNTLTTHGAFNSTLQTVRLTPIEDRLKVTLGLAAGDVIRVPVLYDLIEAGFVSQMGARIFDSAEPGGHRKVVTAAYTPCAVNLQIFDKHALVPRQHGPRMKPADVVKVLEKVGLPGLTPASLPPTGNEQWVRVGTTAAALATTFNSTAAAIRGDPRNAGKFTPAGAVKLNWDLITIPEDTIDLFEAFMHVRLTALGLTVHFIEDWDDYHAGEGEVHCGTNVRRTPVEADVLYRGVSWWDCESVKG